MLYQTMGISWSEGNLGKICMIGFCLGFTRDDLGKTPCLSPQTSRIMSVKQFRRGEGVVLFAWQSSPRKQYQSMQS